MTIRRHAWFKNYSSFNANNNFEKLRKDCVHFARSTWKSRTIERSLYLQLAGKTPDNIVEEAVYLPGHFLQKKQCIRQQSCHTHTHNRMWCTYWVVSTHLNTIIQEWPTDGGKDHVQPITSMRSCYMIRLMFRPEVQSENMAFHFVKNQWVLNPFYTEHCSVWSYQTYRDYYYNYNYRHGTDEDFWMKISRRF